MTANQKKAFSLIMAAANKGYPPSQYLLGVMYSNGKGVKDDVSIGLAWMTVAARNGDKMALSKIDTLKAGMSKRDINRANSLIQELSALNHP